MAIDNKLKISELTVEEFTELTKQIQMDLINDTEYCKVVMEKTEKNMSDIFSRPDFSEYLIKNKKVFPIVKNRDA